MVDLTSRRDAFENRFAHEEMLRFKAIARRNKLIGLWAAEQLRIFGFEAEEYAKSVVLVGFEEFGDDDVVRKIVLDFEAAGNTTTEIEVRRVLDQLSLRAMDEIKSGERPRIG